MRTLSLRSKPDNFLNPIYVFAFCVALTACGSSSQNSSNSASADSSSSSSVSTCVGNCENLPAAYEQQVQVSGLNGPAYSYVISNSGGNPIQPLETASTLRVNIAPLPAPNLTVPGYTNWNVSYGCLQVTVVVNGATQTTQVLNVSGQEQQPNSMCYNAPTSQTLDFSSTITGYGPVTVTIEDAQFDNCRLAETHIYGCSMSALWQNDMAAMNVTIQTDKTYMP